MMWDGMKVDRAHRISYRVFKGTIPQGFSVLHKCDVPSCINPDHLFVGTQKDNMSDCSRKGRIVSLGRKGEDNPAALLTEQDVLYIRVYPKKRGYVKELADKFNVKPMTIWEARNGKSWKHLNKGNAE